MVTTFLCTIGIREGLGHLVAVVPWVAGIWEVMGHIVAIVPCVAGIGEVMGHPCATVSFQIVIPEHKVTVVNIVRCRARYGRLQEVSEL